MLGELGYLDGRIRRLRFTLGCVIATLLLPPWGRAAAGVWAMIAVAVGSVGLYASVAIRYGLGVGDWVAAAILVVFLAGYLLAAGALLRRPGVAVPGLLGGLFVALAWLTMRGFTFYGVIGTIPTEWEKLVLVIGVPLVVGAAGTLWGRDAAIGRRVARLAAISGGLGLYLYGTLAVAVLGRRRTTRRHRLDRPVHRQRPARQQPGRPADDLPGHRNRRMGRRRRHRPPPQRLTCTDAARPVHPARKPRPPAGGVIPMTMPDETGRAVPIRNRRRTVRIVLLCVVVAAMLFLAAVGWLRG